MEFCCVVGIGNGSPQAAFLAGVVKVLTFIAVVIRDGVGINPSGENIGLCAGLVQHHILVCIGGVVLRITGNLDGSRRCSHTLRGGVCCAGSHRPAVIG